MRGLEKNHQPLLFGNFTSSAVSGYSNSAECRRGSPTLQLNFISQRGIYTSCRFEVLHNGNLQSIAENQLSSCNGKKMKIGKRGREDS